MALVLALLGGANASAQETDSTSPAAAAPAPVPAPVPPPPGALVPTSVLQTQVTQADAQLHVLSKSFSESNLSDNEIATRLTAIAPIQAGLIDTLASLTPRLAGVDARLAELGAAPASGQPAEAPEIALNRRQLNKAHQALDGDVKQAKLLQVEAAQIASMLSNRRREQLEAQLWTHSRSILDPFLWRECAQAFPGDMSRLQTILDDQGQAVAKAWRSETVAAGWSFIFLASLLIAIPGRIFLNRLTLARISRIAPQTRLRRTLLAVGRVIVGTGTPLLGLVLAKQAFAGTSAITPVFEQLGPLFIRVVVFAAFFESLGRALLSPSASSWRLAPIPDAMVSRLRPFPAAIGAAAAIATLARGLNTILGASQPTAIASDCITVLIELLAVGGALAMLGRERSAHLAAGEDVSNQHLGESRLLWIIAAILAWLTLAASLVAVLLGYVEMASTLMTRMIWIATVCGSLFLTLRFADDLFPAVLAPEGSVGRFLQAAIGLSQRALEQLAVLLSGAVRLSLLLIGWAAILAPFGTGAGDLFGRVTSSQLVIKLGQVSISPGALVGALTLFFFGLFVTRVVRTWLEKAYLPKTQIDLGLRSSLAAGVTYIGALVAILLTFGYLGLSFDRIALFASALSVGIGFGLQSVIGNFVSGLILLAERPVRVGDWIAIGDLEGDVKKINVRATEIEMPDRSKLIVPNSDLISKTVRNVTHSGSLGRLKIVLKIVDSADPAAVRDLVLARLNAHPDVRKDPAAAVFLSNVGDGALEFTAFAYVDSPRVVYRTRSELLFQIVPDLREKGLGLANSSPVVNVALQDRSIEPAPDGAAQKASSPAQKS